jgi:hypothetical protein
MKWNECNLIAFGFFLGGVTAGTFGVALHLNSKLFLVTDGRLQWETLVTGLGAISTPARSVRRPSV